MLWVDANGQPKLTLGITEDNYIIGSIPYFGKKPIQVEVYQGTTLVWLQTKDIITDTQGNFKVCLTINEIINHIKTLDKPLKLKGSYYTLKHRGS